MNRTLSIHYIVVHSLRSDRNSQIGNRTTQTECHSLRFSLIPQTEIRTCGGSVTVSASIWLERTVSESETRNQKRQRADRTHRRQANFASLGSTQPCDSRDSEYAVRPNQLKCMNPTNRMASPSIPLISIRRHQSYRLRRCHRHETPTPPRAQGVA